MKKKKKTTAVACPCIVMLREALKISRHPHRVSKKIVGLGGVGGGRTPNICMLQN